MHKILDLIDAFSRSKTMFAAVDLGCCAGQRRAGWKGWPRRVAASGDATRILAGSIPGELARLRLRSVCGEDDYLFLRYRPVKV